MPSESTLGFPNDPTVDDLTSWQPAFDQLRMLYGTVVGTSRRLGKDLSMYKLNERLLNERLALVKVGPTSSEFSLDASTKHVVQMQEFPREHLYRIDCEGRPSWNSMTGLKAGPKATAPQGR